MGSPRKKFTRRSETRVLGRAGLSVGVVLAALILAGCTEQVNGSGGGSTETAPPNTSSTGNKPQRPETYKVDGIDACKVLTPEQMQTLKVQRTVPDTNKMIGLDIPLCNFATASAPRFTYTVGMVGSEGIDYLRSGGSNLDINDAQVAGFAALQTNLSGVTSECSYWIDVADGKMLLMEYRPATEKETREQMCQKAEQGAELALKTLKTLQ